MEFEIDRADLWTRTVFPASPAESWFVSASAAYWRILDGLDDDPAVAAEELGDALAALSVRYLYTVSREGDLAALDAHRAYDRYGPYLLPRIKGTFALHQLRLLLGNERFFDVMRAVHDRYAEREMSTADFIAVADEVSGESLGAFIRQWLDREGLARTARRRLTSREKKGGWQVRLEIEQDGDPYRLVTHIEVTAGGSAASSGSRSTAETEMKFLLRCAPDADGLQCPRRCPGGTRELLRMEQLHR